MSKYFYAAVFTKENELYNVNFPDFESCYTSAETLEEAYAMAEDVLCLTLYDMEEGKLTPPARTHIGDIVLPPNSFSSYASCDTLVYKRYYDNKAIRKNCTIPAWLNTIAEENHVNFSSVLQNALKEQLHIENKV